MSAYGFPKTIRTFVALRGCDPVFPGHRGGGGQDKSGALLCAIKWGIPRGLRTQFLVTESARSGSFLVTWPRVTKHVGTLGGGTRTGIGAGVPPEGSMGAYGPPWGPISPHGVSLVFIGIHRGPCAPIGPSGPIGLHGFQMPTHGGPIGPPK